ncbi:MAG TPA: hypothetical protein VGW38_13650 [Chloroflexota bacterium]|nr:hypothetical protein [Chloroflexota bacterium]
MFRNLLIGVAIFGLGWGGSFAAGTEWGKRSAASAPAQAAQAAGIPGGQIQFGGGQGGPGGQGGTGGAAGAQFRGGTAGTVERVEGQTVYVKGPNDQTIKVNLNGQTQILKQVEGSTGGLTAGARVMVQSQGQPAADGSITASQVTLVPAGAAIGGPMGGPGGQGGQRPGGQGGQAGQRQGG